MAKSMNKMKSWYKGLTATAIMLAMAGTASLLPAFAEDDQLAIADGTTEEQKTEEQKTEDQNIEIIPETSAEEAGSTESGTVLPAGETVSDGTDDISAQADTKPVIDSEDKLNVTEGSETTFVDAEGNTVVEGSVEGNSSETKTNPVDEETGEPTTGTLAKTTRSLGRKITSKRSTGQNLTKSLAAKLLRLPKRTAIPIPGETMKIRLSLRLSLPKLRT